MVQSASPENRNAKRSGAMPATAKAIVGALVAALLAAALTLIALRGNALLLDLSSALSAFCL